MKVLIALLALATLAAASPGGARVPLQEEYGYVDVRPGAHMFWVLYHVDQPGNYTDYPLIMWLQGGPGASGVGYGNFEELGPYDINGNLREYAWTKRANVMFVDNPVGAGYSYVDDLSLLTTDNAMIAADLVTLVKDVFTKNPDLQLMPFYVFAESYGGKMTVDFALAFDQAIKNGEVVSDFRGVALGDSWIAPMDFVNTWGTFLYQMGFVTLDGLLAIDNAAALTQASVDAGNWVEATNRWGLTELVVMNRANNVNFYNVLAENDIYRNQKSKASAHRSFSSPQIRTLYENHVGYQTRDALGDFMNGPQAAAWGIPDGVVWDGQGGDTFDTLAGDFMKPVVDSVVRLLTETELDVVVFTGNLDLICDTPGTLRWIENMEWPEKPTFMAADNSPIYITAYSSNAATLQKAGKFSLYTILRSGHMVPIDAPEMSIKMLDMIFASSKKDEPQQASPKQEEAAKPEAPVEPHKQEPTKQEHEVEKQEAPTQHALPMPHKLVDLTKLALLEEAEKEKEAAKQEESVEEQEETKQEEHEEEQPKKQEEHKEQPKKQEHKKEQLKKKVEEYKQKQKQAQQEEHKKELKKQVEEHKQEEHEKEQPKKQEQKQKTPEKAKTPKKPATQEHEQEQKKAPKLEKVKEKVAEKVKQKQQEKAHKQEQKQKTPEKESPKKDHQKEAPKQEKVAPKQEAHKQEAKKGKPLKDLKKLKANIDAARGRHYQRAHQRFHSPGPLPNPHRIRP